MFLFCFDRWCIGGVCLWHHLFQDFGWAPMTRTYQNYLEDGEASKKAGVEIKSSNFA